MAQPEDRAPAPGVSAAMSVVSLLSGLLGLYVGLDYIPRLAFFKRWFDGFEVFHALLAQARATDLLQDYGGARALLFGGDAYQPTGALARSYVTIGYTSLSYVSTHPPTAFLVLLPVGLLSWGAASAVWAIAMIAGLVAAVRISGTPWYVAALLGPILVLLPPVGGGVNQLTMAVVVLTFVAYRFRDKPIAAGALIGIASITKVLPALLLAPLLVRRQWSAAAAFAATWLVSIAAVAILNVSAIQEYLRSGTADSAQWIAEPGNGALFAVAARSGVVGIALALALVAAIGWHEVRDRSSDVRMRWARWNWLATALLPITWSFSVLSLSLSVVVLFHRRSLVAASVGLLAFAPLVFTQSAISPLPTFVCTAGVGLALIMDGLTCVRGVGSNGFMPRAGATQTRRWRTGDR